MHYYPFGLTMAGISDEALLKPENRFKFNGKELNHHEFSDGSGWEMYDYVHRGYDPQLRRFISVDGLANKFPWWTPYQFAGDMPTRYVDLDGYEPILPPLLGVDPPVTDLPIGDMVETGAKASEAGTRAAEVSTGSETQEHHLIPRQLKGDETVESARQGGFKFEGQENKTELQRYSKETGEVYRVSGPSLSKLIHFCDKN